jgi:hypothetical protein
MEVSRDDTPHLSTGQLKQPVFRRHLTLPFAHYLFPSGKFQWNRHMKNDWFEVPMIQLSHFSDRYE